MMEEQQLLLVRNALIAVRDYVRACDPQSDIEDVVNEAVGFVVKTIIDGKRPKLRVVK